MTHDILPLIRHFLDHDGENVGRVYNEHSLQLELGCFLRGSGCHVEFERPFMIRSPNGATRKPKRELDLLVANENGKIAIELKVPLAGRVPETMYDFCADIAFIEGIIGAELAHSGAALLMTNDRQFWQGEMRGIYASFRGKEYRLTGTVPKPTGTKDSVVVISGSYVLHENWRDVRNARLMASARYLLVEVTKTSGT